ncbi:alpha/beta fold hydrolase [Pseudorhodoferax sp. Leaf265]|uniref:alpha/beta fold hydrolase n=1 Tax=Pseudorhodoferax sp. Leaf265 TaxID=1736315 RepID=UPI0006F82EA0|nr:alpha/beta hydrolase [Pseudorhodoferax sp. Leaf265]KQP19917.1 alpha/beta hydrolase [Pseudorhodoferax sp. Leaf265]
MTAPVLHHVVCPGPAAAPGGADGHRMAYWQWGDTGNPHVVVCVHGLSRQGRDFDALARVLAPYMRVVCPDVVGRGRSDWLADPAHYQMPVYAADMLAMLAQLQAQSPITQLDWVGTSMGGLIGLVVAGQAGLPLPAPVRRLVLNDVGPVVQWDALQRIGTYLGKSGTYASLEQAAAAMWAVSTGFGPHSPQQWLDLSRHMVRPAVAGAPDGPLVLHYDPRIAEPFGALTQQVAEQGEAMLWQLYDRIEADTLLLRGADSDLLTRATAEQMVLRGPRARLLEFAGVGHAPTLVADDQRQAVVAFLK